MLDFNNIDNISLFRILNYMAYLYICILFVNFHEKTNMYASLMAIVYYSATGV